MSVASRQNKSRKEPHPSAQNHSRRGGGPGGGAWRGAHNNPSIMHQQQQQQSNFGGNAGGSPIPNNNPGNRMSLPPGISMTSQASNAAAGPPTNFAQPPPASHNNTFNNNANGPPNASPSGPHLPPSNLIGQMLNVNTRTGSRHQGILTAPEPQQPPGIALKDAKDVVNPGAPMVDLFFIPAQQIANWHVPDMSAPQAPAANISKALDSFRTDTDISNTQPPARKDRELQAWRPDAPAGGGESLEGGGAPFAANHVNGSWDQFAANEKLFGMTTNYDEEMYTTRLDRNASDYKERERRAQQIANEIIGVTSSNPHVREERGMDDSGMNEEDKFGAVVRGPNAYIPPAARRQQEANGLSKSPAPGALQPKSKPASTAPAAAPAPAESPKPAAATNNSTANVPKVSVNSPDGGPVTTPLKPGASNATPAASPAPQSNADQPAGVVASFKDFVSNEKQRLTQKKQAIQKSEKDKRLADLIKFSTSFKLKQPIPEDLVGILAKDEQKQKEIVEKSMKDANSTSARTIAQAPPTVPVVNGAAAANTTGRTPAGAAAVAAGASGSAAAPAAPFNPKTMVVQAIPPYRGPKSTATNKPIAVAPATKQATQPSPSAQAPAPAAKLADTTASKKTTIRMSIPAIPPFDPSKRRAANAAAGNNAEAANKTDNLPAGAPAPGKLAPVKPVSGAESPNGSATSSNSNAFKLSRDASAFRPSANAPPFKPSTAANNNTAPAGKPKPEEPTTAQPPNPFFGTRPIKKGNPVHLKEEFNPFKHAKVVEANAVPYNWQFTGKRYIAMFPPIQQHPTPAPVPPPPPPYEEDPAAAAAAAAQAAQAQARMGPYGMMYAYPYPYANQAPPAHMMVTANAGPPGPYMQPQFVPHMPYPPPIPNAAPGMYAPPQLGGLPPPGAPYLPQPPPQGAYAPNGGPRGSIPPTPLPQHAYAPYHHQSPQLAHAHVPYGLMMPPPGPGGPPHGYDGQQPPGAMGVGH